MHKDIIGHLRRAVLSSLSRINDKIDDLRNETWAKIDLKNAFGLNRNHVSLRPPVAPKEDYTRQLKFLGLPENKVFERKTTARKKYVNNFVQQSRGQMEKDNCTGLGRSDRTKATQNKKKNLISLMRSQGIQYLRFLVLVLSTFGIGIGIGIESIPGLVNGIDPIVNWY